MQAQAPAGRITCCGCHVTLAYPLGATSVRCPMCGNVTPIAQIRITCVTCRTVLMLPSNTTLAMCPRCRTVMNVPPEARMQALMRAPVIQGPPPPPPKKAIYIENPPLRDEHGKKVSNVAVGTKLDDDAPPPQR